jgi:hypothetical protein
MPKNGAWTPACSGGPDNKQHFFKIKYFIMISVTGEYLINIIERHVSATIISKRNHVEGFNIAPDAPLTNEEIADFILSIPYFDEGVKNFILGNAAEKNMIVSQAWEIAFILRTKKWAEAECWVQNKYSIYHACNESFTKQSTDFLRLPY